MDIHLCLLIALVIVGTVACRTLDLQASNSLNVSMTAGKANEAHGGKRVKRDVDSQQNTTAQAEAENTTAQAEPENTTAEAEPVMVNVFLIILYVFIGSVGAVIVGGVAVVIYRSRDQLHDICCRDSDSSSNDPLSIYDFNVPIDSETPSRNDSSTFPRNNREDFTGYNLPVGRDDRLQVLFPKRNLDNTLPDSPVAQTHSSRYLQPLSRNTGQVSRMPRSNTELRCNNRVVNMPHNNSGLNIVGNNNQILYCGPYQPRELFSYGQALPATSHPAIGNEDRNGPVIEELP